MPKLDLDSLATILRKVDVQPKETAAEVIKEANKVIEAEKEERAANKEPRQKQQYVVLLSDPEGKVPAGTELMAWITQIKEEEDAGSIFDRILKAIRSFNLSKKGKKQPAKTIGDGIDAAARKFFKEEKIAIKTKLPVRVVITDNLIPQV